MGFDGFLTPDWAKPYIGWVVGMDWPEGDEAGCFRLADACVTAAHQLVTGSTADDPSSRDKIGANWNGAAHLAFAERVSKVAGGQVADLVNRLVNTAVALNNVGVQIQYAKYMIEATVWLLIVQVGYLLAVALPSGGASLALIPIRLQLARLTVAQIAKRTLLNIAMFAGIVAGMDAGAQLIQMAHGRRDELDVRQLAVSAISGGAMGAMMGLLSGGLNNLATPALRAGLSRAEMTTAEKLLSAASSSVYGQAAQYAITGGLTTAGTLLAEGNFSWDMLAKGITSSALGADGQHLATPITQTGGTPTHLAAADPARPDSSTSPSTPGRTPAPESVHPESLSAGDSDVTLSQAHITAESPVPVITTPAPHHPEPGSSQHGAPVVTRPYAVPEQGGARAGADRVSGSRNGSDAGGSSGTGHGGGDRSVEPPSRGNTSTAETTGTPGSRTAEPGGTAESRRTAERADTGTTTATGRGTPRDTTPVNRIDQLLNHDNRPGADSGAPASAPHATSEPPRPADATPPSGTRDADATAGARTADATPPPADRPVSPDTTADTATQSAHTTDPTSNNARVPFNFEGFFNDPRWSAEATRFEQRLGAYYFNNPQIVDTARAALGKLRDVLTELTPRRAGEGRADFTRRVESAFFRDDAHTSAGQVGRGVTIDELLTHGNLRELMTAFYNGAYFNHENPGNFGKRILDIFDGRLWDRAEEAGLSIPELRNAQHQLDTSVTRRIMGAFDRDPFRFARDPFGTGNVVMRSERGLRDLAEVVQSQASRRDRTPEKQQNEKLITTPEHYDRRGAPLGRYERAFIDSITDGPLHPDTPLPWREGIASHDGTSSRWARNAADNGFLVIDGVSATTTRMLTAAKFLNLGPAATEHFLGALMGWMLPGLDHSLFEIMRGAQIADVGGMRLEPGARTSAVDLYRNLPGLDIATLRGRILPDGMLPHESGYLRHAMDPDGFIETQSFTVRDATDRAWSLIEPGRSGDDPVLANWLRRHGIDPDDRAQVHAATDRLSRAHVMALTVYTGHSHSLINNMIRTHLWTGGLSEGAIRTAMTGKVNALVSNHLGKIAARTKPDSLPNTLRSLLRVGSIKSEAQSPLNPLAQSWVDAGQRADNAKAAAQEHRAAGRNAEARAAEAEVRAARTEIRSAWRGIRAEIDTAIPRLLDEMRWHADMIHDALLQLPAVGSPEQPVRGFRGDWITPVHSPIYGSRLFPHGTAREFLSATRLLDIAIKSMVKNPAGGRKALVVYQLTGGQARDISIFSRQWHEQEVLLPPHSRTRRVHDPELVQQIRADVDRTAEQMFRDGQIPEVPRDYEIIVMEED